MDIKLGMHVYSSDGKHLGSVDWIILEPDTREVFGIIAQTGHFFSYDRVIEAVFIKSTYDDAIELNLTADKANNLPRFVEHEFIAPTPEELRSMPYPIDGGVSGAGATVLPLMWRSTFLGYDFNPATRSLLESAPVDPPSIEMLSNLPDDALLVGTGTDIIARDGRKVGAVDEIVYTDGVITSVVVRTGLVRHRYFSVPVDEIESITPEHVLLRIEADEIERYIVTPAVSTAEVDG